MLVKKFADKGSQQLGFRNPCPGNGVRRMSRVGAAMLIGWTMLNIGCAPLPGDLGPAPPKADQRPQLQALHVTAALLLPMDASEMRFTQGASTFAGSGCAQQMDFGPTVARALVASLDGVFEVLVPTVDAAVASQFDVALRPRVSKFKWHSYPTVERASVQIDVDLLIGDELAWTGSFRHKGTARGGLQNGCEDGGDMLGKSSLIAIHNDALSLALALTTDAALRTRLESLSSQNRLPEGIPARNDLSAYFEGPTFPFIGTRRTTLNTIVDVLAVVGPALAAQSLAQGGAAGSTAQIASLLTLGVVARSLISSQDPYQGLALYLSTMSGANPATAQLAAALSAANPAGPGSASQGGVSDLQSASPGAALMGGQLPLQNGAFASSASSATSSTSGQGVGGNCAAMESEITQAVEEWSPGPNICRMARDAKNLFPRVLEFYERCPINDPSGEYRKYAREMIAWAPQAETASCDGGAET